MPEKPSSATGAVKKKFGIVGAGIVGEFIAALRAEVAGRRWGGWLLARRREGLQFIRKIQKMQSITHANYELGRRHYQQERWDDAVLRFRLVVWLTPGHVSGWYWLGMAQLARGEKAAARAALQRAQKLKPDWPDAAAALAALDQAKLDQTSAE